MMKAEGRDAAQEVVDRVRELAPKIREWAPEGESLRRLPDATLDGLRSSGMFRLLQPQRWGGYEAHPRQFYEAVMAVGAADGSAAWIAGVVGVHAWEISLFAPEAQELVWGSNPDTLVSSSYMLGGRLKPAPGGFRLSGRWSFSSGSDHCDWVIIGTPEEDEDGNVVAPRHSLLPRSDYRIDDVWHTMGLRGTGSNDIVVEDVFVPEFRTLRGADLYGGTSPGLALNTAPLYRLTFPSLFANAITSPVIGMAEGMVAEAVEFFQRRVSAAHGATLEKDPYTIAAIAKAAREASAARHLLLSDLTDLLDTVAAGDALTLEQRARTRRNQILGLASCVAAIDEIFDRAGAAAINVDNPMQRMFRDAHAARHHAAGTPLEPALHSYTRSLMGLGIQDPLT